LEQYIIAERVIEEHEDLADHDNTKVNNTQRTTNRKASK